ncbi:TolC family protein [Maribellus maritimus]|uniref:TolC family protein n=1 Tax=Maribellus maritimus TaxID=2870838 RepID=UPI001EEBC144|nr:TolC family protein [Maribellus maritimus]MCG6186913.1 TolC family protein [Maribellus maritimus]
MTIQIKLILGVAIVLFAKNIYSQSSIQITKDPIDKVDIIERLPSLAELQEIAVENSPISKLLDADIKIGNSKINEEKRLWMKSLGIEGNARYGIFDNLYLTEDYSTIESTLATTKETRFYIGGYIKIPISDIIDRSNVKTAIAEKEKLQYQKEAKIIELRQLIIVQYNEVIKSYRKIQINTNAVETYRLQMIRAEIDFNNGKINVAEYARLDNMLSKTLIELEDAKLDFATALQVLEETVGIKINLKP